jgi:cytochrome c peroxidase
VPISRERRPAAAWRIFAAGVGALVLLAAGGSRAADLPADDRRLPARIALGRALFFDPRSSPSGTIACATCHRPDHGFSDPRPRSLDVAGEPMSRHTPTLVNRAGTYWQGWSGRHTSLEDQARHERNRSDAAVRAQIALPEYRERFRAAFGGEPSVARAAEAIAAFVRTVTSSGSPYDRYVAGEATALDPAARRGLSLFMGRGLCVNCHPPPAFTDEGFNNVGVGMDRPDPDPGRAEIYGNPADTGAFKTPTLRDVGRRGPYMHDGSLATLDDVVAHYDRGGVPNRWLSSQVRPLRLTAAQRADLVAFLRSLSGTNPPETLRDRP